MLNAAKRIYFHLAGQKSTKPSNLEYFNKVVEITYFKNDVKW